MKKLLPLLAVLYPALAEAGPLFCQNFESGIAIPFYASSTPTANQFTTITSESGGGIWTVNSAARLQLVRTGNNTASNGAGLARCADFSATAPGVLCIRFDFGVKSNNSPTIGKAMCMEVGGIDAAGDHNVNSNDATVFSRFNVGLHESSFRFYMHPTQSPLFPANEALHRMTYIMNKSGTAQAYRAPNGSVQSVDNGRMALWMDDVALYSNFPCINAAGSDLNNIRISFPSNDRATWTFDNFVITNGLIPDLYSLPAERLAETRAILRAGSSHPRYAQVYPAFAKLKTEADAATPAPPAMAPPPPTVLDSDVQPALTGSEDRDYFSIGTYWTKDPANPNGPWINTPSQDHPENAYLTDEAAMTKVCTEASTLCLAAWLTPDAAAATRYTQRAVDLVRAWFLDDETGMNPHLEFGACVPGDPNQTGRGAGIIDTAKFVTLSDSLTLLAGSPLWTEADQLAWQEWLSTYLYWLQSSATGLEEAAANNNHGTWYDAQVTQYAMVTGDWDLARRVTADAREKRLYKQTWSSGKQPAELDRTASLPYSTFNLRAMVTLAKQADWHNVDWWDYVTLQNNRSLRKTIDFVGIYAVPYSNWAAADPDSPASAWGDRLTTREMLAVAGSHYTDDVFRGYLAPFASGGFTFSYDGVSQYRAYAEERWKLFAPAP